jgi:rSAM/selenodomain-associated transferase 2
MKISIIIPVLNESLSIVQTLSDLQSWRVEGHEVIVVDGGSEDRTAELSRPFADQVLFSPPGRGLQMNAGANVAKGNLLLFLHADTSLPKEGHRVMLERMKEGRRVWGRFDVRLSGKHFLFRVIEWLMNWRSRITGVATGDQAIFVQKELFKTVGGFPDIHLMEDIALSKSLKKHGPPLCLPQRVTTSSRRWEKKGILRTVLLMWFLRLAFFLGVDPKYLAKLYGPLTHPSPLLTAGEAQRGEFM